MNKVEENEKVSNVKDSQKEKKSVPKKKTNEQIETNKETKTTKKSKIQETKAKTKAEVKTTKKEPVKSKTTKATSKANTTSKVNKTTTSKATTTNKKTLTKTSGVSKDSRSTKQTKTKTVKPKVEKELEDNISKVDKVVEENKEVEDKVVLEDKEIVSEKTKETANSNKEEAREFKVTNINFEDDTKKSVLHKYSIAMAIIMIILFVGLVVFSTVFALMNRASNKIVSGISIKNIDVSGLTYSEATEKINKEYNEKVSKSISLKCKDYEININPEEIEASFGTKEAIDISYSVGRSGKLLKDNYAIINANLVKVNINPSLSYNEAKLDEILNEVCENLPNAVEQSSYIIEGDTLKIFKGKKGYVVKKEELKAAILDNIINLNKNTTINIPLEEKEPDNLDIEKIHSEIYKEAKNAYYTKEPFTVYPHVDGVDFNISIEEAKALINNEENEVIIPLKITTPTVTTNQIGTEAFPDLLATYSTTFSTKNGNRTTNIKLASNKINGVVLMPGEEFSYNKIVGQRTAAAGYKTAAVYVGGKVENGIGGGICQVSSTLYNTALRANLEIVKRSNHRFATGYVPLSADATVSWGGPEFVFKNTRNYPIKIVSTVTGGKIKVDIYGLKEDVEYEVIIQSQTLQVIPMKTEYRTNPSLPAGTTKKVQSGHAGYKSRAYRILKLNGEIVSKQLLSTDTYAQLSTIIETN